MDCENIAPMAKQVREYKCYAACDAIAIRSLTGEFSNCFFQHCGIVDIYGITVVKFDDGFELPNKTESSHEPLDLVENIFADLSPCVLDTGMALTKCFLDDALVCLDHCPFSWSPLTLVSLTTCPGILNNALKPVCEFVGCCQVCMDMLAEFLTCVENDLPIPCDLECESEELPDEGRRLWNLENITSSTLQATNVIAACLASGVPEDAVGWTTFINCVVKNILGIHAEFIVES